ncbi:MAG: (2Fe-2S)-binding protein [Gammaproteobacteria bacterium]|nr:(2Fe-2S)-binding protein [Gammaproteobacteria bacterium]
MVRLTINGTEHELDVDPDMPLLWALRDHLGLTGAKYGCGMAQCGACMVHVDGAPMFSCITPLRGVGGRSVVTIEGLDSEAGRAVQRAWSAHDVVQCGFCQSGQIMAATALLTRNADPGDADIDGAMSANLCRCATYARIREAIKSAAKGLKGR